ncbi:MAG: lanthionine synthetase LanC family protein [Candidatus Kariarchaeaceae archaeon]|jgi:lantibiotic modifying enzyme
MNHRNWSFVVILLLSQGLVAGVGGQAQVPVLSDRDPEIYYGLHYGSTGIVDPLIDYSLLTPNSPMSDSMISLSDNAMQAVWESRAKLNNISTAVWTKGPHSNIIYPGMKYGAVGIAQTMLKLANVTSSEIWEDRVVEVFTLLLDHASNTTTTPSWSYSYSDPDDFGPQITDILYGASGILELAIDLYTYFTDDYYLDIAERIYGWLESVLVEVNVDGYTGQIFPWFDYFDTPSPYPSGLYNGNAGMMVLLKQLALLTERSDIENIADGMLEFYLETQKPDGSWDRDFNFDYQMIGLEEGVGGILLALDKFGKIDSNVDIQAAIDKGKGFIFDNYVNSSGIHGFYKSRDQEIVYNGLQFGTIGVVKVLTELWTYLSSDEKEVVLDLYNHLIHRESFLVQDNTDYLLMMTYYSGGSDFVDFSYANGLSGLSHLLTGITGSHLEELLDFDITEVMGYILNTYEKFETDNHFWHRQQEINPNWDMFSYNRSEIVVIVEDEDPNIFPLAASVSLLLTSSVILTIRRKRKSR